MSTQLAHGSIVHCLSNVLVRSCNVIGAADSANPCDVQEELRVKLACSSLQEAHTEWMDEQQRGTKKKKVEKVEKKKQPNKKSGGR